MVEFGAGLLKLQFHVEGFVERGVSGDWKK
jgi:hypothetical protein